MTENKANTEKKLRIHAAPDLDYVYRDLINIHVGAGEVVLELGNQHRSMPGHGTIYNRIVLSVSSAHNLCRSLQQALAAAEEQVRKSLRARREGGGKAEG